MYPNAGTPNALVDIPVNAMFICEERVQFDRELSLVVADELKPLDIIPLSAELTSIS
jgi:phosphoribosylaminoimidazole carboxylase (NCAIR synthetase)